MPAIKIICNLTTAPLASDDMVRQLYYTRPIILLLFFPLTFCVALVIHILLYTHHLYASFVWYSLISILQL